MLSTWFFVEPPPMLFVDHPYQILVLQKTLLAPERLNTCELPLIPRRTPATWLDCISSLVFLLGLSPAQNSCAGEDKGPATTTTRLALISALAHRLTILGLVHLCEKELKNLPRKHGYCHQIMENNTNMRRYEIDKKQGRM